MPQMQTRRAIANKTVVNDLTHRIDQMALKEEIAKKDSQRHLRSKTARSVDIPQCYNIPTKQPGATKAAGNKTKDPIKVQQHAKKIQQYQHSQASTTSDSKQDNCQTNITIPRPTPTPITPNPKHHDTRAIIQLSRAHHMLSLRFQSLLLSFQIFKKYRSLNPQDNLHLCNIISTLRLDYLVAVCLNLAVKYQEIYPPGLREIALVLKVEINHQSYCLVERSVLIGIGYTLNLRIAKEYLAATILKNRLLRYQAYYLIEMVYSDADARTAFTLQQVCASVCFLMQPLHLFCVRVDHVNGVPIARVEVCVKWLVRRKDQAQVKCPWLVRKYMSERYWGVASMAIMITEQEQTPNNK